MTTDLARIRQSLPTATPMLSKSLSPESLIEHRTTIAFEVKTVLSAYFQPHESEQIKAAQLAWWADDLQDWEVRQVRWAMRKWNADNPRTRPTPGDIVAMLKRKRGEVEMSKIKPEPIKETPSPVLTEEERLERKARADQILRDTFSK